MRELIAAALLGSTETGGRAIVLSDDVTRWQRE